MRSSDIVLALSNKLPLLVDDFNGSVEISGIVNEGYVNPYSSFLITTSSVHNLSSNDTIKLDGCTALTTFSSFVRVGNIGTIITTQEHDLTTNSQLSVTVSGAVEPEFNGQFNLLSVINRFEFTVAINDTGPLVATGVLVSPDIASYSKSLNGLFHVLTIPTLTSFTVQVPMNVTWDINTENSSVKSAPRISASSTLERFLHSYTKQPSKEAWIVVVLGDAVANKSKNQTIDAVDNIQRTQYFNQRFAEAVDIYVFYPTTTELSGRSAEDRCRELLQPLCQCVLMETFDSLLTAKNFNPLQFISCQMFP